MKRYSFLQPFLVTLVIGLFSVASAQVDYKFIPPTTYTEDIQILVSGKERQYYVLDGEKTVSLSLEGPCKLKVMSRLEMSGAIGDTEYSMTYVMDGGESFQIAEITHVSAEASHSAGKGGALSVMRTKVIEVPKGLHRFDFHAGENNRLYIRFSYRANAFAGITSVIAMTPFEYSTAVDLISGEVANTYYRVSSKDRVVLKLIGPVTLKVLTRIENTPEMHGAQKWKVAAWEDGSLKKTFALVADLSGVNKYKESMDLVPSKAETFFIEVPEGEHVYEFKLPENHRSALLRFLLPSTELDRN